MGNMKTMVLMMVALVLLACQQQGNQTPQVNDASGVMKEKPFDKGVTITDAKIPARYTAPLPSSVSATQHWMKGEDITVAPVGHVADMILMGKPEWLVRLQVAAEKVPTEQSIEWIALWHEQLRYLEPAPAFCAQVKNIMLLPESTMRSVVAKPYSQNCEKVNQTQMTNQGSDIPIAVSTEKIQERVDALIATGFTKVSSVNVTNLQTDDAVEILIVAGHAHWFDVETGMYPNQHDILMRNLAVLVTPELDGAVFEEIEPLDEEARSPYRVQAYWRGKLYQRYAENHGDWYDVEAVLSLMNTMLRRAKSNTRFHMLATDDQTAVVVAASQRTIANAFSKKLLKKGAANQAMDTGKEFEDQVLRSLESE